MSNWFSKCSQSLPVDNEIPEQINDQEEIRYRVTVPIDLKVASVGDDFKDQANVFGILKTLFDVGSEQVKDLHRGINIMLNFSDIKTYANVMEESGL